MSVYLGQVIALLLVIMAFKDATWVDGVALGVVALVVTIVWQGAAMLALRRARVLVYDEPRPDPDDAPLSSAITPVTRRRYDPWGSGSVRPVPPGCPSRWPVHSPRRGCEPERGSCTVVAERHRRRRRRGRGLPGPGHRGLLVALDRQRHQQLGLTRPAFVVMASVVIIGMFFLTVAGKLTIVPGKRQWVAEQAYGFVRNSIARDVIGSKDFKQFLPLLMTLFTLILFNNVMGVMPFIQFPSMSRIAFPIVLTLIVYVVYHTVAIRRKHGVLNYLKSLVPPGLPGWLKPIMFVLEFLTYFFIRPLTLALRLFGNMLAGHLMLLVFILGGEYLLLHGSNIFIQFSGILGLGFGVVMTFFELLVQFLQAFIFTLLAALYISDAVSEHH